MAKLTDKQLREVFHLVFLERLLKISDPKLYVLKGGVNLRFFLGSPRYSEDMDLDAFAGSVPTLKKNGYKILDDASFLRVLKTYGIDRLIINDRDKAKQTETTQRFRLSLVNEAGEEFPTQVEFSRRQNKDQALPFKTELISPQIIRPYNRPAFMCQHYLFPAAAIQKIEALANRVEIQSRDPFDFFYIYSTGKVEVSEFKKISPATIQLALENLMTITFSQYQSQVVEYLDMDHRGLYGTKDYWNTLCDTIVNLFSEFLP